MQFEGTRAPAAGPVEDWRLRGACVEADPGLFFGPDEESEPAARVREGAAVAVCGGCPVRRRCRSWALAQRIWFGVWGGLTEAERQQLLTSGVAVAS
jgi:WhiB family redox-sensing transcriptional regulator